jgi:hypothetical protein
MEEFIAKVSKISLNPGDVLAVTLKSDYVDGQTLMEFKKQMQAAFPDNKVMLVNLSKEDDIQYSAIGKDEVVSETKA